MIQSIEGRCLANVAGQHISLLEKRLEHMAEQVRSAKGQVLSSSKFEELEGLRNVSNIRIIKYI